MRKNKSRKNFTTVFKNQAVEMAGLRGEIPAHAQELQINETNLRLWITDPRYSTSVPNGAAGSATTIPAHTAQEMKYMDREQPSEESGHALQLRLRVAEQMLT